MAMMTFIGISGRRYHLRSGKYKNGGTIKRFFSRLGISPGIKNPGAIFEVPSAFDFIPTSRHGCDVAGMLRLNRQLIISRFPEVGQKLEHFFQDPNAADLRPKMDVFETAHEKLRDPEERERFVALLDSKVDAFWRESRIIEVRPNSAWQIPEETLAWDAEPFCRKYRELDNFDLILGSWVERNVPEEEERMEAFVTLFLKWCPEKSNLRRIVDISALLSGTYVATTTFSTMIGVKGRALKWSALAAALGTAGYLVFVNPNFYSMAVDYFSNGFEQGGLQRKVYKAKSDQELSKILMLSAKGREVREALMVWVERAETARLDSGGKLDVYPHSSGPADLKNFHPVLFHISHPHMRKYLEQLDPQSLQAAKEVEWALFTSNAMAYNQASNFIMVAGIHFGSYNKKHDQSVIAVATHTPDGTPRSELAMLSTFAHEATHAMNKKQGELPLLFDELSAMESGARSIRYFIHLKKKEIKQLDRKKQKELRRRQPVLSHVSIIEQMIRGLKHEIALAQKELKPEMKRVRVARYLAGFGKDFETVYPQTSISAAMLQKAGIKTETLLKYIQIKTKHPELDQQLIQAIQGITSAS